MISQSIDNANQGDTIFVRIGTHHENLAIDKTLMLIRESANNTMISANGGEAINTAVNNVTATRFVVQGGNYGIYLQNSFFSDVSTNVMETNA
jgi:hypothetical protein